MTSDKEILDFRQNRCLDTMTNWQRHQWAKAGYRSRDILKFANMVRPSHGHRMLEELRRVGFKFGRSG